MDQRGDKRKEKERGEGCWRVFPVLGRNNLNNTKIAAFHDIHPLSLPSGLERSVGDSANNREWGVNPSYHCQWSHIRVTASLFTLLLHFPYSLFCGLYLTGGGGYRSVFITHLTPPHPSELYPRRCLWGGRQDVRPTRRSKYPLQINVPLLTVTFSTQIGLTSQTHARLGLQ